MKKNRWLQILSIFTLFSSSAFSFFDSEIGSVTETLLYSSINKSELEEVERHLAGFNVSKSKGKIDEGFGHYMLGLATGTENPAIKGTIENSKTYVCSPKIVTFLLKKGAKLSEKGSLLSVKYDAIELKFGHLTAAIRNLCPESVDAILKEISNDDLISASNNLSLTDFANIKNNPTLSENRVFAVRSGWR